MNDLSIQANGAKGLYGFCFFPPLSLARFQAFVRTKRVSLRTTTLFLYYHFATLCTAIALMSEKSIVNNHRLWPFIARLLSCVYLRSCDPLEIAAKKTRVRRLNSNFSKFLCKTLLASSTARELCRSLDLTSVKGSRTSAEENGFRISESKG